MRWDSDQFPRVEATPRDAPSADPRQRTRRTPMAKSAKSPNHQIAQSNGQMARSSNRQIQYSAPSLPAPRSLSSREATISSKQARNCLVTREHRLLTVATDVVIELVSSLTPDDEKACATALLQHLVTVLQALPIAYAIRIQTDDQVLHHSAPLQVVPVPVGCASPGLFWASQIAADAKPT
jgi:hypothetical protein